LRLTKFSFQAGERMRSQKNYLVDTSFIEHGTSELSGENLGYQLENVVYLELSRT
jgi:predicted AAA+ superfamily ATPase